MGVASQLRVARQMSIVKAPGAIACDLEQFSGFKSKSPPYDARSCHMSVRSNTCVLILGARAWWRPRAITSSRVPRGVRVREHELSLFGRSHSKYSLSLEHDECHPAGRPICRASELSTSAAVTSAAQDPKRPRVVSGSAQLLKPRQDTQSSSGPRAPKTTSQPRV